MNNTTLLRLSGCAAILAFSTACTSKRQTDENGSATPAAPSSTAASATSPDAGAHEPDPAKAIERHLNELKRLVPDIQGVYVDLKDSNIVLDVYAPVADAGTLENHRLGAERLLGHPVRINLLASRLVQQPAAEESK